MMRVGLTSIFSFRPHVEHLAYLASLLSGAGHEIHSLTCDAALSRCYSRLLRERSKLKECPRCILGGVRTFPIERVQSIDSSLRTPIDSERLYRMVVSSAAVRYRTEAPDFLQSGTFLEAIADLAEPVETAYANAMRWVERNRLDAVVLFNGRMDALAGIAAACEDVGVPYVTIERPWLGHGISMFHNANCLDLRAIDRMNVQYRDLPLLAEQARFAGALAANTGGNRLLWRVYNRDSRETAWPTTGSAWRVLILPSSRNEFEGHPDWMCGWKDYTQAFDDVMEQLQIRPESCVLRCHPNWAEKIGAHTGWRSEQYYTEWANLRGIHLIGSRSRASTYDLMAQADLILVNGSSTGVEAACRGKQVILVGHATYQQAGICASVASPDELTGFALPEHDAETTVVRALRHMYVMANRFPQYVRHVRAISTARCEYRAGADSDRITSLLRTGNLIADDASTAADDTEERKVAAAVLAGDWETLTSADERVHVAEGNIPIRRRAGLRWIDTVRERMPRGDA